VKDLHKPFRRIVRIDRDIKASGIHSAQHGCQHERTFLHHDRDRTARLHAPADAAADPPRHHGKLVPRKFFIIAFNRRSVSEAACCMFQIFQNICSNHFVTPYFFDEYSMIDLF
jgi:hypothetical protein